MSSITTLSGRNGKVFIGPVNTTGIITVARITNWTVNPRLAEAASWADSDTAGYQAKAPGAFDAAFSTEGKYDTVVPVWNLFQPGDKLIVELWLHPLVPLLRWQFPSAMCLDFLLVVDVDTEEVIGWSAEWGSDGVFYKPGQA
jgi:hypothetical protein